MLTKQELEDMYQEVVRILGEHIPYYSDLFLLSDFTAQVALYNKIEDPYDPTQVDENDIRRTLYRIYNIALDSPLIIPRKKICTCGAKHTSFPNHHYDWCDLGEK